MSIQRPPAGPATFPHPMESIESTPKKPRSFDFCFIHLDYTLVRVEEIDGQVTIRATADTFSRRRRACFIRELEAEGFISEDRRFSLSDGESQGIRWLIDPSWVKPDKALMERNNRLARRFLLPLAVVWLASLYLTVSSHGGLRGPSPGSGTPRVGIYGSR